MRPWPPWRRDHRRSDHRRSDHRRSAHRRGSSRVLVVPDQWSGSVQQYYHFILGYLAPLLLWCERQQVSRVSVRDCGPMNRWFDVIAPVVDVEIMSVGDALHVLAGRREPAVVLRGMDYPDSFDGRRIAEFRDRMLELLGIAPEAHPRAVTVIDRAVSDPFFHTPAAEVPMSGAERRAVPNLRQVAGSWEADAQLGVYELSDMDMREQVVLHTETRLLVAQHGAGLTNMIWMRPGGTVIEIHPPLPGEAVHTFERLARACGHTYLTVPQESVHSDVDPVSLTAAVVDQSAVQGITLRGPA